MLTKVSGPILSASSSNFAPALGAAEGGLMYAVGDLVQICSDIERMKVLQRFADAVDSCNAIRLAPWPP